MSAPAAATRSLPAVLYDIDWHTYTRLLRVLQTNRRFRLTYDRGTLEIMPPLWEHERPAGLLGRFIEAITEEFNIPCLMGKSVTLRRRKKQRGLEPDECYWIASVPRLLGKTRLDLRTDPPPDLAIEVDVTSRSLDRLSIYAALGVPEVWRLSNGVLTFLVLQDKRYRPQPNSLAFPTLAATDLLPFLASIGPTDETALVRRFREWVRNDLAKRSLP